MMCGTTVMESLWRALSGFLRIALTQDSDLGSNIFKSFGSESRLFSRVYLSVPENGRRIIKARTGQQRRSLRSLRMCKYDGWYCLAALFGVCKRALLLQAMPGEKTKHDAF
jgi:hypothetical protein